jgi:hypothetical protein
MAYFLPRAVLVLIACSITCGFIQIIWPDVDPAIFYVTSISWALMGLVTFGYLYKLRQEASLQDNRPAGMRHFPT